jgi:hypothetical protein
MALVAVGLVLDLFPDRYDLGDKPDDEPHGFNQGLSLAEPIGWLGWWVHLCSPSGMSLEPGASTPGFGVSQ